MKKLLVVGCTTAALAVPQAALAGQPQDSQSKRQAVKTCQELRKAAGKAGWKALYGSNGIGKCIRKETAENKAEAAQAEEQARKNAAKECKDEREQLGEQAFTQQYGGKRNAYGKCVSQKAKQNEQEQAAQDAQEDKNQVNAARECKKERQNLGSQAFTEQYGGKRNAFGKCVSKKAREKNEEQEQEQQPAQL